MLSIAQPLRHAFIIKTLQNGFKRNPVYTTEMTANSSIVLQHFSATHIICIQLVEQNFYGSIPETLSWS